MNSGRSGSGMLGVFARLVPVVLALTAVRGLARGWAWLGFRAGFPLPRRVRRFPDQVAHLFGRSRDGHQTRGIIEARLVYSATHLFSHRVLEADRLSARRLSRGVIEAHGQGHLESALARGRGVILLTAHFGFPQMIRPVLETLGLPSIAARSVSRREGDIALGEDLWARARAFHRLRAELAENRACVLLADGTLGDRIGVPFFHQPLMVGLGAFALSRLAACPVLPFFVVAPLGARRFRVEILPPLPADTSLSGAVEAFVRGYAGYVERYPCHLARSGGALAHRLPSTGAAPPEIRGAARPSRSVQP